MRHRFTSTVKAVVFQMLTCVALLSFPILDARGENPSGVIPGPVSPAAETLRQIREFTFVPAAYRREAIKLMLEEANVAARQLNLGERLPIQKRDLVGSYVSPPRLSLGSGMGLITTERYNYCFASGEKLSSIMRHFPKGEEEEIVKLVAKYSRPLGTQDTNAAFVIACQFLKAAQVDVAGLNRDFKVKIIAFTPEGRVFVPRYWVRWYKHLSNTSENTYATPEAAEAVVAVVEFVEPNRLLLQLCVEDPKYILRREVRVKNLQAYLSETNAVTPQQGIAATNSPMPTTK